MIRLALTAAFVTLVGTGCDGSEANAAVSVSAVEAAAAPKGAQVDDDPVEAAIEPAVEPRPDPTPVAIPADFNPAPAQDVANPDPAHGPPIEDPAGSMRGFYEALGRTESKAEGAITRVLHMGDSSIGLDGLPHAIRRRLMEAFGDAGPGFVLFDRMSQNYRSNVAAMEGDGWQICYIAYLCRPDGHYGLGGHVFRGGAGAWTRVGSARKGFGHDVSRIELWYADQPKGGRFKTRIDRGPWTVVDTRADALTDRWQTFEVESGGHTLKVRGAGGGYVRLYGAVLENDGPGVVWDTASMIGAFTKRLHGFDDQHIAEQIEHRDPDLVVLNYGGNDLRRLVAGKLAAAQYKEEYRTVLRKLRGGADGPQRSCLIVSVIDHGRSGPLTVRRRHIESMVHAQRELAYEEGCAFFDSVAAMGGPGSLRKWLGRRPRLAEPDLKHLNRRGRDLMGDMIYRALMAGYETSKTG